MTLLKNNLLSYIPYTVLLIFITGLPTFIFYSIGVLAPIFIQEFSIDKSMIGFLSLGTFFCSAILSLWAGNIVRYLGVKKCTVIIFISVFISFLFLIFLKSFLALIIALLFCGVGQSLCNPVTNIMITECVDERFKSIITGIKQSGLLIFALFAGLFIPYATQKYEWQFTFILLLPFIFILIIFSPKIININNNKHEPLKLSFIKPNKPLFLLMSTQICISMTLSSFVTYIGIFSISLKMNSYFVGLLISLYGVMGITSRILITSFSVKLKNRTLLFPILISLTITVIIILIFANEHRHWPIWVAPIGLGLTASSCNTIGMSLLIKDNQFGQTINSSGLLSSASALGYMLGPILFGIVQLLPMGLYAGWFFIILILLIALSISFILYKKVNAVFLK